MRRWAVLAVLGMLAGAAPAEPATPAPAPRPDVLLITIDTLRADAVGFEGNRRGTTPTLDRLAARGRVYTRAHAHNVVTLPSHANLLTGLLPYQHGIRDNSGFRLPDGPPTLADALRAAGYATGAFVGAYPLDSRYGLDRGFEVYDDRTTRGADEEQFVLAERRGDEVVDAALAWWRARRGRPRFLWVHLYDPHAPYEAPAPFAARFADNPYLGEVAATDAFLAPLVEPLLGGKEPPCLVVVTSDHGEALGDHGEVTHGLFAYEATLRVPLLLWGPGVTPGRDARAASHVDVFTTIVGALGLTPLEPAGFERHGRSLLVPWTAEPDVYFEALSAALNRGWAPLRGLLRPAPGGAGQRKFIALPLAEVYDLERDPGELKNLVDSERRAAREAFALLPAASAWPPPRGTLDAEEEARLRSLGYLASTGATGSGRSSFGPEDDPKSLVALDRKIHDLIDAYQRADLARAVALARELIAARPSMPLGHTLLANALLEAEHTAEALEVMERARAAGAASDSLLRQLGLTLAGEGRSDEAIRVLEPLAAHGDLDALNAVAVAHTEAGRQREAFLTLQKVLAADPDNPKAFEHLGLVELRLNHWRQARDASRRAVELRGGLALAWNNLGVAHYELGEVDAALAAWQEAVARRPDLWDALWNLGLKAAEHGRAELARTALRRFAEEAPASRSAAERRRARALLEGLAERHG
jgi:arylsulfatase A-like enzyme/Flp pilus assembly protein TadD